MTRKIINVTNEDWLKIIRSYIDDNTVSTISEIMKIKRTTIHKIVGKHHKINQVKAKRWGAIKK